MRRDRRRRCLVLEPERSALTVAAVPEYRHLVSADQMSPDRRDRRLRQLEEMWGRAIPYHPIAESKDLPLDGDAPAEVCYYHHDGRLYRAEAGGNTELAEIPGRNTIVSLVRVSPDRRFLACTAWERRTFLFFVGGKTRLIVLDMETGVLRTLLGAHGIDALVWSPDGETLYVSARDGGESGIYRLRLGDRFEPR
jgi:hypothetical protein